MRDVGGHSGGNRDSGVIKHFLLPLLIKLQAFYSSPVCTNLGLDKEIKSRRIQLKNYVKVQIIQITVRKEMRV